MVHTTKTERRGSNWTFVQTKAPIFHNEFAEKESDFTASADWLYKHKKMHYVVSQIYICGEILSVDSEWCLKFAENLEVF